MLKVNDLVKVISKTSCSDEIKELIPIGTICKVIEICYEEDGTLYYGICPINNEIYSFYYLENELVLMHEDKYSQFTKDRLIEIATQALHELIEIDSEAAYELINDLDLSLEEIEFFGVEDTVMNYVYDEIDEELELINEIDELED